MSTVTASPQRTQPGQWHKVKLAALVVTLR
jgi:hypothetical protein